LKKIITSLKDSSRKQKVKVEELSGSKCSSFQEINRINLGGQSAIFFRPQWMKMSIQEADLAPFFGKRRITTIIVYVNTHYT
jgi:hypothetical protein